MTWLRQLSFRFFRLLRLRSADGELQEEIRAHIEAQAQENIERGMDPANARRAARLKFGSDVVAREESRDAWGFRWLEKLWQDVRFAARMLIRSPGFTIVAALTLSVGIGLNVAVFTVLNGLLLRPLPYPNQERLVLINERTAAAPDGMSVALGNFADWQERQRVFDGMAAYLERDFTLSGVEQAESVQGVTATGELFRVLGVPPFAGRTFDSQDARPGAAPVAVISYGLWQSRFGGAPVVGRDVLVDGQPRTIVGVMPPSFSFPDFARIWIPEALDPASLDRASHSHKVVARLSPGVDVERARAEMSAIAEQLRREYPAMNAEIDTLTLPLRDVLVDEEIQLVFLIGMVAVGFVLLIVCANLANLFLARGVDRDREVALRAALGASRWRITRLLFVESLLIAGLGAAGGLVLGPPVRDAIWAFLPVTAPGWLRFDIDPTVAVFVALLAVGTAVLSALVPSLRASKPDLQYSLRDAGARSIAPRTGLFRSSLVVSDVALALVLLVSAGLMTRSLINLLQRDPGFNPENVLTLHMAIDSDRYPDAATRQRFYFDLIDRLRLLPGVRQAGAASFLPESWANWVPQIVAEGTVASSPSGLFVSNQAVVTPGYFEALGIPVLRGRDFGLEDGPGAQGVVIVNDSFARQHWPDADPIGRRLRYRMSVEDEGSPWLTVVGVVGDVHYLGDMPAATYLPLQQNAARAMSLAIRTDSDPMSTVDSVRRVIAEMDPDIPPFGIQSMATVVRATMWQSILLSYLLGTFSIIALGLASVGVYGVLAYTASRRTREIGIRIALGAEPQRVQRELLWRGMRPVVAGIALGLAGSYAVGNLLRSLLFGLGPTDPLTLAGMTLVLFFVAAAACYLPAHRATRVDPMEALRQE